MQRTCLICGAEGFAGARFCRRCGAPVRHAGDEGDEVSPQAATVPLGGDDARLTDGLGPEEPGRAADTSRVSRAELERLLRAQSNGAAAPYEHGRRAPAAGHPRFDTRPDDPEETLVAQPRAARPGEEVDEELTITVARPSRPLETRETAEDEEATAGPPVAPPARRRRAPLVALCCAGLVFAVAAAWLAARLWLRPATPDVAAQAPALPDAPDPRQLFDEKLTEAEALLAQGDMAGAQAALREANRLIPSNAKAHYRLGELLVAAGRRREAIEEFRAAARHDPGDPNAWRQLAAAQSAEGLYADAAESYRRLIALAGAQSPDPNDLLSLADALRLAGRTEEARALYERLSALPSEPAAGLARQRLAELAPPPPTPAPSATQDERAAEGARAQAAETAGSNTPAAQPAPSPSVAVAAPARPAGAGAGDRYRRGVELWASNRAAALEEFRAAAGAGNADAHYYLGLSYVEGRSPQSLKRAELVAALAHFQNAQRGQFAAQARRHAQQLEREFDRIRKQ